ncbi:FG-GAP repeat protein [Desulfobulbus sp. F5]|nr:FG-GAP repeat protein [Desulfobulbus sp. F5]
MNAPLKHLLFLTVLLVLAISTAQAAIDSAKVKKLSAGDGAAENEFGWSVSVSGDTAVIGTFVHDNKGAAYVFTRTNGVWSQQQKLVSNTGGATDDFFGYSVSVSGDTAIIGAYGDDSGKGAAYVFTRTNDVWSQQQKLVSNTGGATDDFFGNSVSLSGDTAIIGASGDDSSKGAAYIFTRMSNGQWTQQQPKLTDNDGAANDHFGISVSVSGDTAIIGASGNNNRTGAAYVFTRTSGVWTQQGSKLTADDGVADDYFGYSVAVDGDTAIIGAYGNETETGAAYVFTRTSGVWTQQPKLTATDGSEVDWFGSSVSMDGDTVVVGASGDDSIKGAAYIFTRSTSGVWTQQPKLTAADGAADDYFGYSVAVDGNTVVVGAYGDDMHKGSAYVFGGPVSAALPAINFLLLRN